MAFFNARSEPQGIRMSVGLPVAFIQDKDSVVAYTPALDLSTCGKDKAEAEEMFREATRIFFEDLVENETVDEVLSGLGWKKNQTQNSWTPPQITQESIEVKVPVAA